MIFKSDDQKIIQKLKKKDEKAMQLCLKQYFHYVAYIVDSIIGKALSYEDKEEVISEVFISLWHHADRIDSDHYTSLKPYLGAIARNKAKNALRKIPKITIESLDSCFEVGADDKVDDSILKKEILACVSECILELSNEEQICFISYYYYQKTITDISKETGLNESTIKSKLMRCRKKLKLKIERKGFLYEDCRIFSEGDNRRNR